MTERRLPVGFLALGAAAVALLAALGWLVLAPGSGDAAEVASGRAGLDRPPATDLPSLAMQAPAPPRDPELAAAPGPTLLERTPEDPEPPATYTRAVRFVIDGQTRFPDSLRIGRLTGEEAALWSQHRDPQQFSGPAFWPDLRNSRSGVWEAEVPWVAGEWELIACYSDVFLPEVRRIDAPARPGQRVEVEVDLIRAAVVDAVVLAPLVEPRFALALQRRREGLWGLASGNRASSRSTRPRQVVRFAPLTEGHYRVYDEVSGKVSPGFDLRLGETARPVLDLRHAGLVRGHVEVPAGYDRADVRLVVEHAHGLVRRYGVDLSDGSFALSVPGDEALSLRAEHPGLTADPATDGITVVGLRDDVVLRLLVGDALSFLIGEFPRGAVPGSGRLHLMAPGGARALHSAAIALDERRGRLAIPATGTFDVVLDLEGAAPLCLREITIGAQGIDLGVLDFVPGTTLSLDVRERGLPVEVPVRLFVERHGEPRFWRSIRGERSDVQVPGLGPGRYTVSITADRTTFRRELEVLDERDVSVSVDLAHPD